MGKRHADTFSHSLENTGQEGHFEKLKTALPGPLLETGLKRMEILTINCTN